MTAATPTRHPCEGMSEASIAVFEQIATEKCWGHPLGAIRLLLKKGLIARDAVVWVDRGVLGVVAAPAYAVPTPIHMQWCKWCSENVTDGEDAP